MWILLLMPCPLIGPFIFRDLVYNYQLMDPGLILCAELILPWRSFRPLPWCCIEWLFPFLVRWLPCIWITALQKLICVIKVVQCLLFMQGWSARYWVWLTSTVLLLFQHTFLPSQCGGQLSVLRSVLPEWHLLHQMAQSAFAFRVYQRWTCWHPPIPLSASIITPWKLHYFWRPWGWMPSTILGCLRSFMCFLLLHRSSSSVQVPGRTCRRSTQIFDSGGTKLDGGSLASHHSQHVDRCSLALSLHKRSCYGCLIGQVLKGLQYLHLTLWLLRDACCTGGGSLPQSVRQWWGQLRCLCQRCLPAVLEGMGRLVYSRVYQTMLYLPLN